MKKMEVDSPKAHAWVEELQPRTWIKAFSVIFQNVTCCSTITQKFSTGEFPCITPTVCFCTLNVDFILKLCSYILEAREFPILSMLETIFYKIMHRNVGKQKECEKWTGVICPKIKKKLDKATEWARDLDADHAGNGVFHVSSSEFERSYIVDMVARTCDCRRWQLSGIPCHHAIACCRTDNRNPEKFVHSCYSIATYKKAYAYNLEPLRARVFWEKMNAAVVHPPLYTKVMGRPKKNRRKTPEEKEKNGVKYVTKAGVPMHCSICKNPGHNKKGHAKWVLDQNNVPSHVIMDDDNYDDPSML